MQDEDIETVSQLHIKSLSDTISSKIGSHYLENIYKSATNDKKNTTALVALDKNKIIGVVVATKNLDQLESLIKKNLFIAGYVQIALAFIKGKFPLLGLFKRIRFEKELVRNFKKKYLTFVIIYTVKNHRGKGIATKLVKKVISSIKDVNYFYVDTISDNQPAIKLYKSLGFKLQKKIEDSLLFLFTKKNA